MKFSLSSLLVAAATAASALAAPAVNTTSLNILEARGGTPSAEGWHSNYFYSWWTDNKAYAIYTNHANGRYTLNWQGDGNLVGGKGWNPGHWGRVINYSGQYQTNQNSYLAAYGWTRNSLIEYYIVESYGSYNPSSAAQKKGSVYCNGGNYDILTTWRNNQPSIDGTQTFQQFWSVRNPKKPNGGAISGTIDTACHFQAWANHGMRLGSNHYYLVFATEGYYSSGASDMTVW